MLSGIGTVRNLRAELAQGPWVTTTSPEAMFMCLQVYMVNK